VLVNVPAVGNLIREGKTFQIPSTMQVGLEAGMITFESYLGRLVTEGKVDKDDADTFLGKKKKADNISHTPVTGGSVSRPSAAAGRPAPVAPNTSTNSGIRITSSEPAPGIPLKKKIG
jgi:twitching motility protein PilT